MRLFVAVELPAEAVEDLDAFLDPRRDTDGPRWNRPDQWHLTLAFMPQVPERLLDDLTERLTQAVAGRRPVPLSVAGGGCFPDAARARVLWGGIRGGEALAPIARAVRSACAVAGGAPEGGPFRAHLTLARFPRPIDATRWVRVLDTYAGPSWEAVEICLVQSHLASARGHRPRHEVLARARLT